MADDPTNPVHRSLEDGSPPGRIGAWTLGRQLGQGGSSIVFAACKNQDGFEQHGAVKLLQTGAHDDRFVARFERERRILIDLVHPHIVRLLDGGSTSTGVPWFAMEYIRGSTFTTWAKSQSIRTRLRAFVEVCRAVDFAHRHMVVHCDLKPENVLVDESGSPHVLDFGIARLMEHSHTGTAQLLTPRWAAPEQVRGESITTATDVFALGLLLSACLTGTAPRREASGAALLHQALQPVPPPSLHTPVCRGDLDAIVLRATASVPEERYNTAVELARDVERHLDGEAVRARSGLLWYRTSRWLRRHRAPVLVGIIILGLLTGWAASVTQQSAIIRVERDAAQHQLSRAETTLDLLMGMLRAANPSEARGDELTVGEVLDSALLELDVEGRDPALSGEVRLAIGRIQHAVGNVEGAETTLKRAVAELETVHPNTHPTRLAAELELAVVRANLSDNAVEHVQEAERVLASYRLLATSTATADALLMVADLRLSRGDFTQAAEHAEAARSLVVGHDSRRAARAHALLGGIDCYQRRDPTQLEQALTETREALGTPLHPEYAEALHELAYCTSDSDLEAERWAEVVELRRHLFGPGWMLAVSLSNHAMALKPQAPDHALRLLEEASDMARKSRGDWQPRAVQIVLNHAAVQIDHGVEEDASTTLEAVTRHLELPVGLRARAWRHLSQVHERRGQLEEARAALHRGLELVRNEDEIEAARLEQALVGLEPR